MGRYITLGDFFKFHRKIKKYSLRDVEKLTSISNAAISQIETSKIKNPTFRVVCGLCRCYGMSVSDAATFIDLPDVQKQENLK